MTNLVGPRRGTSTETNIGQKAWDYALISVEGDVIPEEKIHLLAANIQVILDGETAIIADFCRRFDTWILNQASPVQTGAALTFGEEYQTLRRCILSKDEGLVEVEPRDRNGAVKEAVGDGQMG